MDFENLMVTPAMYRDIPSSMMFAPYMMSPYTMSPMLMPPLLGVTGQIPPMQPGLSSDKFERIQNKKDSEGKHTFLKAAIAATALTAAGWILSKRFKIPKVTNLFKNFNKTSIKNYAAGLKTKAGEYFTKVKDSSLFKNLKNLFKKPA